MQTAAIASRVAAEPKPARDDDSGYSALICAAWRRGVDSILETSRLLLEARTRLPPGTFTKMVEDRLPFKARHARRLMEIGRSQILTDPRYAAQLPSAYKTLCTLARLDPPTLVKRLADGTITPKLEERHAVALLKSGSGVSNRSSKGQAPEKPAEKPIPACVAEVKRTIGRVVGALSAAQRCELFALVHNLLEQMQRHYIRRPASRAVRE